MIELDGVQFSYSPDAIALATDRVTFEPGLTLVLGPNGSGKSTLLRVVAAVERPDAGRVRIAGHDPWRDEVAARRDLAYVPEQPELTPYATIGEILRLVATLREVPRDAVREALERVGLADAAGRSVRELSQGERRRAVLAAAFVGTPRTIVLDEPLEALDRAMRDGVLAWIAAAVADGATVVVATHDLDELAPMANAALAVRRGSVRPVAPLPGNADERRGLFEAMARGEVPPGR